MSKDQVDGAPRGDGVPKKTTESPLAAKAEEILSMLSSTTKPAVGQESAMDAVRRATERMISGTPLERAVEKSLVAALLLAYPDAYIIDPRDGKEKRGEALKTMLVFTAEEQAAYAEAPRANAQSWEWGTRAGADDGVQLTFNDPPYSYPSPKKVKRRDLT